MRDLLFYKQVMRDLPIRFSKYLIKDHQIVADVIAFSGLFRFFFLDSVLMSVIFVDLMVL